MAILMKKISRILFYISLPIIVVLILSGIFMLYSWLNDYEPAEKEPAFIVSDKLVLNTIPQSLSLITWNIGYAGLGKDVDYFYEGGKMMRPSVADFQKYINGILNKLYSFRYFDFVLLQEIDTNSRRSYYMSEIALISKFLPEHKGWFAKNYDVKFVPVPLSNPSGKVIAGVATYSKFEPTLSDRISFRTQYPMPEKLFSLDRCFLLQRYPTWNGKELILINTHNSAFDATGKLRKIQMEQLKTILLDEYARGNYVIAGGDWNMNPAGFDTIRSFPLDKLRRNQPSVSNTYFPPGWQWCFDASEPTNRDVNIPYKQGITGTTVIDYFIISPNVKCTMTKTLADGFAFSDHHPVILQIEFMESHSNIASLSDSLNTSVKIHKKALLKPQKKKQEETDSPF